MVNADGVHTCCPQSADSLDTLNSVVMSCPSTCSATHGLHCCEKIKGHDGLCECHCGMKWPNAQVDAPSGATAERR